MQDKDFLYLQEYAQFAKKSKIQEISPGIIMEKFQQKENSVNYYYIFIK